MERLDDPAQGGVAEELDAMCEQVAALAAGGMWEEASSSAAAALERLGSGGGVQGRGDHAGCSAGLARWLAWVVAKGAWDGGRVLECAKAMEEAGSLRVSLGLLANQLHASSTPGGVTPGAAPGKRPASSMHDERSAGGHAAARGSSGGDGEGRTAWEVEAAVQVWAAVGWVSDVLNCAYGHDLGLRCCIRDTRFGLTQPAQTDNRFAGRLEMARAYTERTNTL